MTKRRTIFPFKRDPQFSHPFVIFSCAVKRTGTFFLLARQSKKAGYNNETARRQAATVALAGFREAKIALQWPNTGARLLQGCLIHASEGYKHTSLLGVDRPDKLS